MNPTDLQADATRLARALIDQSAARILVPPQHPASGFWFGGGNVVVAPDGSLLLCGRYRNHGDSRTGVAAGERGLELALFRAHSVNDKFEKLASWSKANLSCRGREVVSIEGSSLLFSDRGVELFVSTEKDLSYPADIADFQKAGTGVWSIDVLMAPGVDALPSAEVRPLLEGTIPSRLHVKDPTAFQAPDGSTGLLYCNHPYTWSSSNTSLALRPAGQDDFSLVSHDWLPRGPVWDVAVTRVTDRLPIPPIGPFAGHAPASLYFYCGAESLRQLDENPQAVKRPRGWSCEEIGGLAMGIEADFPRIERVSVDKPFFTSPHGTGCSRYVSTVVLPDGIFATWQQSQADLSQPLVGHFLPNEAIEGLRS